MCRYFCCPHCKSFARFSDRGPVFSARCQECGSSIEYEYEITSKAEDMVTSISITAYATDSAEPTKVPETPKETFSFSEMVRRALKDHNKVFANERGLCMQYSNGGVAAVENPDGGTFQGQIDQYESKLRRWMRVQGGRLGNPAHNTCCLVLDKENFESRWHEV